MVVNEKPVQDARAGKRQGAFGLRAIAALFAAAIALSACGSDGGTATPAGSSESASDVTIADTWVKSTTGTTDPSMTAAFGVITNASSVTRTIVSATNDVSDRTELHEMAMENGVMVMREIADGITIPANGSVTLEPGGMHVMLMDLTTAIEPGDDIHVTLTLDDGSTLLFHALAKEFAGGNEQYHGGDMTSPQMDVSGTPSSTHSDG